MSIEGPGTILGGLPVIAVVTGGKDADTPNGPGEYWTEVVSIHWMKRDGSKGKEIPDHIRDRAEIYDYHFYDLSEQVFYHLNHEQWLAQQRDDSAGRMASPETQSTGSAGGDQPTSGVVAQ